MIKLATSLALTLRTAEASEKRVELVKGAGRGSKVYGIPGLLWSRPDAESLVR